MQNILFISHISFSLRTYFICLLFLCFSISGYAENHSIVFVHIGKEIPSYAQTALSQARLFNKNCPIILLANQEALNKLSYSDPQLNITYIPCEALEKTESHKQFLKQSNLDTSSREGFWLYTSERFLYLADIISQYQLENVFHLEYDNMLYANLESLLPIFTNRYQGIAATFDNDDRCIAGIIYIANSQSMNHLAKCFADHANKNLNDMQLIALFKKENSNGMIDNLPIIPEEYVYQHTLVSPMGHTVKNPMKFCQNADLFQSIFDAAALGQFLGGIDPRNGPSIPGFINESCVFNPSFLTIEWQTDELHRSVPYIVYPHTKYRINNLHIHSKNLELFKSQKNKQTFSAADL